MSSLDPILRPASIAVIGASRQPDTVGWQLVDNLLRHHFQGPVYPVNPNADSIHSVRAYASIKDVPQPVDLAVIVVPSVLVLQVARECVEAGVRGLVVISAGFKEIGGDGVERERELVALARNAGVRLVGPNCVGVLNSHPSVRMNATFAPAMPPPGPVAFMSQSGAMGVSILDYAESLGIGVSMFVSAGNKADVSGNDLIEYWRNDPDTHVILLYLENFGNPARFVQLAREVTRSKPICVVKSGRTGAGARAAASHTGAIAGTDLVTDAIIAQAGAIRAQTVDELFDLAMGFANQPLPRGNRVAIVTNAGGPGIIIADTCEANGLEVTPLAKETEKKLRARLPEEASVKNPVDLIATATAQTYEFALDTVFSDPDVDAAIAAFVPPLGIQTQDVAQAIVRVNERHYDKSLLAVLMGRQGLPAGVAELQSAHIPAFTFPESAARTLGAMWKYGASVKRAAGETVTFDADDDVVRRIVSGALEAGRGRLSEPDALRVLEAYGVRVPAWDFVAKDASGSLAVRAAAAAESIGFPVALKLVSPDVAHKTDVGGVVLELESRVEVEGAAERLVGGFASPLDGLLVQAMAPKGTETIVGATRVPRVGPMIMFGMGGVYVEVMRDVVLRLGPLLDTDAREMIRGVRLYKLLEGVRGEPPRDLAALEEVILRVSQLAERHPEIVELDVNPLIALEEGSGALAVDVRVGLAEAMRSA